MSYYDDIYELAADNYGVVTSKDALSIGVPNIDLVKMARRGQLDRLGYGVYRLARYFPTAFDKYAEAVALVGEGAYIYGESVLAMHGLALVNPMRITVAAPARNRRKLPRFIEVIPAHDKAAATYYEGIRSQSVADAIRTCCGSVMPDRLLDAIGDARRQGLVTEAEAKLLKREIKNGR